MEADLSPGRLRQIMFDEEPEFSDVLTCVFDIQQHESEAYLALLKTSGCTVSELAATLDRDRSNVNRSLMTLREKGLVSRHRQLLDGGGHVYQYTATPIEKTKAGMHDTLDAWTEYVHERIEEYGQNR